MKPAFLGYKRFEIWGRRNHSVWEFYTSGKKQISKEWEVREDKLTMYRNYSITILLSFTQCKFIHLPQEENQMAGVLATLA